MSADNQYFSSHLLATKLISQTLLFVKNPEKRAIKVLEPCAGNGSLVNALRRQESNTPMQITAIEIDETLCAEHGWTEADFLSVEPTEYDVVVCNPPFNDERDGNGNASRGRDMPLLFLEHAHKFAPLLGFIMHQNKGCPTFMQKVEKHCPGLALVERICVPKDISTFTFRKEKKFVPTSIYIYQRNATPKYEIRQFPCESCEEFEFVALGDTRCNFLAKRWGSPNRVGRFVSSDSAEILTEVTKKRKFPGKTQGVNFHILARDPVSLKLKFDKMERFLREHFAYARDCPNVSITTSQLYTFFSLAND